jgi:uncharacterized protein YcbK (DUF882 family)
MSDKTPEQIAQEEQDDFAAAYAGESVYEEPQTDEPEELLDPSPGTLTDETLARIVDQVASKVEGAVSQRLRTVEGHIGGLKQSLSQQLSEFSAAAKTAETQGAEAPSATQMAGALQSGAKLSQLKEEFPEWAEAIEESMQTVMSRIPAPDTERFTRLEAMAQTAQQDSQKQAYLARQMARLDILHPDWEQTIRDQNYQQWLREQPREIQALTESENASDALRVLDAYVAATEQQDLTAQSRQSTNVRRLSSAVLPTKGRTPSRSTPKTEHEAFLEAFSR